MFTQTSKNEIYSEIYLKLKQEIDQLMETNDIDYILMSKIVNKLAKDFNSVIKKRYP